MAVLIRTIDSRVQTATTYTLAGFQLERQRLVTSHNNQPHHSTSGHSTSGHWPAHTLLPETLTATPLHTTQQTMLSFCARAGMQALRATASNRNAQAMAMRGFSAAAAGEGGVGLLLDLSFDFGGLWPLLLPI